MPTYNKIKHSKTIICANYSKTFVKLAGVFCATPLIMRFQPLDQKMFARGNWLLRCSILINVAIILCIGSYVMIGGGNKFASKQRQGQQMSSNNKLANTRESLSLKEKLIVSPSDNNDLERQPLSRPSRPNAENQRIKDNTAAELDPNLADALAVLGRIANESNNYANNTKTNGFIVTGDNKVLDDRLRSILKCHDHTYDPEKRQLGDFWVLKNYIRADHGELKCHRVITYTTHADYTFLDNLMPLLDRWRAPVSIAMHAPGTDFLPTLQAISYLRDCLPESNLVRMYTTFHIYFSSKHIPTNVPKHSDALKTCCNCRLPPPYFNVSSDHLYKTQKKLQYPVNVGRNIARDAALTHFILASDIELYPNPGLVKGFLEMIARNESYLNRKSPRVFPLPIFEVEAKLSVPRDKTELQEYLRTGKAMLFHEHICPNCHKVPQYEAWRAANETDQLSVFHIGKRMGAFENWEPIYIGTHADPHYDERLSWEGRSDKMTQGYLLCVLDYEFHILDNAFLVHKPGIKVFKKDKQRDILTKKTNQLISKIIYPELKILYGMRQGCTI